MVSGEFSHMANKGTVYLVGAGPGDPELLTLKALRLIKAADVVVYDRLVSAQILNFIPEGTARVDVGKKPGSHPVPQKSINSILIKLAKSGQSVVRLKGGDPMIFGRGGEEIDILRQHGVPVETVPGITAAQGCAASLNIPLTQRGISRSVIYLTGHTKDDEELDMDWAQLVKAKTTLVIYMGAANIAKIISKLRAVGLDRCTPAIAIANGTHPEQRFVRANVEKLIKQIEIAKLDGPVLFMIGEAVAAMKEKELVEHERKMQTAAVASL
jgi:uroporphyrin-III C-methyltransferase